MDGERLVRIDVRRGLAAGVGPANKFFTGRSNKARARKDGHISTVEVRSVGVNDRTRACTRVVSNVPATVAVHGVQGDVPRNREGVGLVRRVRGRRGSRAGVPSDEGTAATVGQVGSTQDSDGLARGVVVRVGGGRAATTVGVIGHVVISAAKDGVESQVAGDGN